MYKTLSIFLPLFAVVYYYLSLHPEIYTSTVPNLFREQDSAKNYTAMSSVSRQVVKKVFAMEQSEGVGAKVRRSIGSMSLRNLSPFLMLDHFKIGKGAGFSDHPHRGQATLTFILEGKTAHEDSKGHRGFIEPGGIQLMTAGKGVIHAEMPVHEEGLPDPVGLQLWIDIPAKFKMMEPDYQEYSAEKLPISRPEGIDGVKIRVVSGKSYGIESPVKPFGGCWYQHYTMEKQGAGPVFQEIPSGWTSFIYIIKGAITISDDQSLPYEEFHTLVLSSEQAQNGLKITSAANNTEFIIVSGEPLDQPVVQYGPFVMTTREEIQKTLNDYQSGQNGFEEAHSWESEIGKGLH